MGIRNRVHWLDERMNKLTKDHNDQMNKRTNKRSNEEIDSVLESFCFDVSVSIVYRLSTSHSWISNINPQSILKYRPLIIVYRLSISST